MIGSLELRAWDWQGCDRQSYNIQAIGKYIVDIGNPTCCYCLINRKLSADLGWEDLLGRNTNVQRVWVDVVRDDGGVSLNCCF